jgi:hypothetical protein
MGSREDPLMQVAERIQPMWVTWRVNWHSGRDRQPMQVERGQPTWVGNRPTNVGSGRVAGRGANMGSREDQPMWMAGRSDQCRQCEMSVVANTILSQWEIHGCVAY